jgi:hypothetical protein
MRKNKISIYLLIIMICSSLLLLVKSCAKSSYIELSQREIRPTLKRITGRDLPSNVEKLQAILYSYKGLEDVFIAFQTNQEGCSHMLNEFGSGQDVMKQEFPDKEFSFVEYSMMVFLNGYQFQKKLGIDLFDMDLIERIEHEHLEYVNTSRYPKDAVTGYYLKFTDTLKLTFYRILVFKDLNIVYIFAEKKPKGFSSR